MASIDHPNVIPVYAAGEEDGHLYLVMRYVDGTDLQALLRARGRLPPAQAALMTDQVARALDAAHKQGLVHRDIKPSNVLLSGDHAYLTDFGITRLVDERTSSTDAGKWIGTFDYMSPEQLRGEPADPRSDIYALGCLLYACLVGSAPFHRDTTAATITAHLHEEPPSVSDVPGVPKAFDAVIRRALAKQPKDRYSSAGQLGAAALAAAQGNRGRPLAARAGVRNRKLPRRLPLPRPDAGALAENRSDTRGRSGAADRRRRRCRDEGGKNGGDAGPGRGNQPLASEPSMAAAVGEPDRAASTSYCSAASSRWLSPSALIIVITNHGPRRAGPLTGAEINATVHDFASDYSKHDVRSLSRLLASDVSRVDPLSSQHGRAAVLHEYESQFTTRPVPTSYVLSDLKVSAGLGRARGGPIRPHRRRRRPALWPCRLWSRADREPSSGGADRHPVRPRDPLARVLNLEHQAALGRGPRAVNHPRRPAGIPPCAECLLETKIVHRARQNQHLFEVLVCDWAGARGIKARVPADHSCEQPAVGISRKDPF